MSDLIERDAVLDEIEKWIVIELQYTNAIPRLIKRINELPSVTHKSGKWIRVTDKTGHLVWECDKCSWQQRFNTNFCPDCGADMRGAE